MLISKSSLLLIVSSTLVLSLPIPEDGFRLVKRPGGSPTSSPQSFSLVKRPTIRNGDIGVVSAAVANGPVTGWGKSARRSVVGSAIEVVAAPEWKRKAEAEPVIEAQPEWKREAEAEPQYDMPFPLVKRPIGNPTSAFPSSKPPPQKRESESEPEPQTDAPKGGWKPATAVVGTDGPKGTWKRFSEPQTDSPKGGWKAAAVAKVGLPNQGWKRVPAKEA